MNGDLFSKVISVLFALLLCVNVIPMSAFAHEPVYYPYMLYAHSGDEYPTNASDIIDQCEMTISAMNGILGKYQYK